MKKVLVGGCFDILHSGHIRMLEKAKSYGDVLIVMISQDARVRYKKGDTRPIMSQEERMFLIESLKPVDSVVLGFGNPQDNPIINMIKHIKPDIYVRTNDVNPHSLPDEMRACAEVGADIVTFDRIRGVQYDSSTEIIQSIV